VTPDLKVLALRHFRYAANEIVTEIPGGNAKKPEYTPERVAVDELREETGYEAEAFKRLADSIWFDPASMIVPFYPFLATGCRKLSEPDLEQLEYLEFDLIPLQEWIGMILRGEVSDAKTIVTTFLSLPYLDVTV
jgi:ADP-ribose pyrophosphatase